METFWGLPWAGILVPVLLIHQFEEQVWPGGLVEWWNKSLYKSDVPEFPLSRARNLIVNVVVLLVLAVLLAIVAARWPALPMLLGGVLLGDALVHIVGTLLTRRYSPGLVTSIVVYLPFVYGAWNYLRSRGHSAAEISLWLLIGLAVVVANLVRNWRLVTGERGELRTA